MTFNFCLRVLLKILGKNEFESCVLRLSFYKKFNSYLYESVWRETIDFLNFGYHQTDFLFTKEGVDMKINAIDLSEHGLCKGYKIIFAIYRVRDRDTKELHIKFMKDGKVKFIDILGFRQKQKLISVGRQDAVSAPVVSSIIKLINSIIYDSRGNQKFILENVD